MFGFGLVENIFIISSFGFLFFAALPFANNCLDYLMRTNIPSEAQGRAWGLIGFLSQLGYVVAYAVSGAAADAIGRISGRGVGRGAAGVVLISGICLAVVSASILLSRSIRELEKKEQQGESI
jgi:MFS family permease